VDEPAPRGPQRIRRRDALRLLAASTGAVAGGSLIVSAPVHADVGSEPCLFAFSSAPVVTVSAFNTTFFGDFVTLSMGAVAGTCGCGATASVEYAFRLAAPVNTASSGAWSATSSYSLSFVNLWPGAGGSFTVSAGVRITCTGPSGTTIRCRYSSATFNMPASFGQFSDTFSLPTDNGNSPFPNLPSCNGAALRFAALQSDGVMMVPGPAQVSPELQALIDGAPEQQPIEVLALEPQPDPEQPSAGSDSTEAPATTTPSTSTSSTTSTSTTSTSSTTSTTTTSTSSTTSTTVPSPSD
jgi:hypothetical protein